MKICIPSKNRYSSITTHLFFNPKDTYIFVEPQEYKKYKIFFPEYNIVDIKKTDMGISFVRNFVLNYFQDEKIIMADDDIYYFGKRNDKYRYDELYNFKKMLNDIENGLDRYWTYGITNSPFLYFMNKGSDNKKIIHENTKTTYTFYGINCKKILENNIKFDSNLDVDDIDFCSQIILKGGNFCNDLRYSIKSKYISEGGLSSTRGVNSISLDETTRRTIKQLSEKYGTEFVKFNHDKYGFSHFCYMNYNLMLKRKEVVLKNLKKYELNHN